MLRYKNFKFRIVIAIILGVSVYWLNNSKLTDTIYYQATRLAVMPNNLIQQALNHVKKQNNLITEIRDLKAKNQILQTKLFRLATIQKQNNQLRQLLSSSINIGGDFIVAQLITEVKNTGLFHIVINKGKKDSIYLGQPVLDGFGVIGQVIKIFDDMSIVQVILDSKSAIPVQIGNSARGILVGKGLNQKMQVIEINSPLKIKKGDIVYSSGLGLKFPVGYPIGVVTKAIITNKYNFLITVKPSAHVFNSNQFLLIWPENFMYKDKIKKIL